MPLETDNIADFDESAKRLREMREKTGRPDWVKDCQLNDNGRPINNLANAVLALRRDAAWNGVRYYDEMRRCPMLQKPIPKRANVNTLAFSPRPSGRCRCIGGAGMAATGGHQEFGTRYGASGRGSCRPRAVGAPGARLSERAESGRHQTAGYMAVEVHGGTDNDKLAMCGPSAGCF